MRKKWPQALIDVSCSGKEKQWFCYKLLLLVLWLILNHEKLQVPAIPIGSGFIEIFVWKGFSYILPEGQAVKLTFLAPWSWKNTGIVSWLVGTLNTFPGPIMQVKYNDQYWFICL